MNGADWKTLQDLFDQGLRMSASDRASWLQALGHGDPELAETLSRMLAADAGAEAQEDPIAARIERQATLGAGRLEPGNRIGAWTVDRFLDRGGMGMVYLARRSDESYRQRAVIKVVESSAQARLARLFERERQILADLTHPGIARLLDGGELDDGRPFLVMEYVDGVDIVSHCEQSNLALEERLELFIAVAGAVQFAHANRVIHRDIKPENVLVDAHGQVRLLDFGIAQLLERPEPSSTPDTTGMASSPSLTLQDGLLSPAYASPEQLAGDTITTASDIYSLGLLLHRILTGRLPERDGRIEPPSSRLAPACRNARLGVQGADLDAIVLKALAEQPSKRYASADALIEDLRRFLGRRPVQARPAGRWHLARLFAQRSPALAASLSLSALLVAGFSLGLAALALALERERQRVAAAGAVTEQVAGFMVDLFAAADPEFAPGESISARELLDRGARRIAELDGDRRLQAALGHRMAQAYRNLGVGDRADELITDALEQAEYLEPRQRRELALEQADLWRELGRSSAAAERLVELIAELERDGSAGEELARAYNNYGLVQLTLGYPDEAERWSRRALAVDLGDSPESGRLRLSFLHNLALHLGRQGRRQEAIELLETVLDGKRELFGPLHPSYSRSLEALAVHYRDLDQLDRAIELLTAIRGIRVQVLGEESLAVAHSDNELAAVLQDGGAYRQAEQHYRLALGLIESRAQADPMLKARVLNNLGTLLEDAGREEEALAYLHRSLSLREQVLAPHEQGMLGARGNLARVLIRTGALDRADAELAELEAQVAAHHAGHARRVAHSRLLRAEWLAASGSAEDARQLALASWATLGDETAPVPALFAGTSALRVARVFLSVGDAESAGMALAASERMLKSVGTPEHPTRLLLALYRAEHHLLLGQNEESRRLLDQLTAPLLDHFDPGSSPLLQRDRLVSRLHG